MSPAAHIHALLAIAGAANENAPREDPTVANTLHRIVGSVFDPDAGTVTRAADTQDMKIINIGLARTATSSFVTAMREIGIKSYHMKDGVQDTAGHVDLWVDLADAALTSDGRQLKKSWRKDKSLVAARKKAFTRIAADGFNATADMPMIAFYKELLDAYPKALVVLAEHPSGSADNWAASVRATIGRNEGIFSQRPWRWIPMLRGFLRMEKWCWAAMGAPSRDAAYPHAFDAAALAQFYRAWNRAAESHAKRRFRKLLKFKATDGWEPLCKFVAALRDPAVNAKCAAIVASGAPFPAANVDLRNVYFVLSGVTAFFQQPVLVLALELAAACVFTYRLCGACCGGARERKAKAA